MHGFYLAWRDHDAWAMVHKLLLKRNWRNMAVEFACAKPLSEGMVASNLMYLCRTVSLCFIKKTISV